VDELEVRGVVPIVGAITALAKIIAGPVVCVVVLKACDNDVFVAIAAAAALAAGTLIVIVPWLVPKVAFVVDERSTMKLVAVCFVLARIVTASVCDVTPGRNVNWPVAARKSEPATAVPLSVE